VIKNLRSVQAILLTATVALGLVSGAPASAQDVRVRVCLGDKPSVCISLHPKHPQYSEAIRLWAELSEGTLPSVAYPDGNPRNKNTPPSSGSGLIIRQGDIR